VPDVTTTEASIQQRPVLGLRRQPGRLALWLFRMPLQAYYHGKGWILGHTFVLLTHIGRRSGQRRETVAMVLRYRPESKEVVVCSAWGAEAGWVKNIRKRPAVRVETGRDAFEPEQQFLSAGESRLVVDECLRQHPWRFRFLGWVLGWGDLRDETIASDVVATRPFVAFSPVDGQRAA
jgi:deazaflavin-dependent oxidoreductase (nitroreductase family)